MSLRQPPSKQENWCIVYPAYINAKKTVHEGRKLPKDKCVDNPSLKEMLDVMKFMGLLCLPENKAYPRGFHAHEPGRIRYQLRKDDGSPFVPGLASRRAVLERVAELVSKLAARHNLAPAEKSKAAPTKKASKKAAKKKKK